MKRIISLLTVVMMLLSVCSVSVYAEGEYASTLTLYATEEGTEVTPETESITKLNAGDEFVASVAIGTTALIKALGFSITYDPADIELGISEESKGIADDYSAEIEAGEDTLDNFCLNDIGRVSYVDDAYFNGYMDLGSTKKFGEPTIDKELKADGRMHVTFGYAKSGTGSVSEKNGTANLVVGGVVLKVLTSEAKQTTLTIMNATAAGKENVDTPSTVANSITLNLNGYGEAVEPEDPYALETSYVAAGKDVDVTNAEGESYKVNTALIFGSVINTGSAEVFGTEIILKGYNGSPIDLVASKEAQYNAGADKTGFMAAITSIREANLSQAFVAKAYAVDAEGNKVYGAEKEAIFNDIAK